MTKHELFTQGTAHNYTPPFDGRDLMRNRDPHSRAVTPKADCGARRYSLQTRYANGVGIPTMMESPTGEFVRYTYVQALELHNEMLLMMMRKAAEERLADARATIEL